MTLSLHFLHKQQEKAFLPPLQFQQEEVEPTNHIPCYSYLTGVHDIVKQVKGNMCVLEK